MRVKVSLLTKSKCDGRDRCSRKANFGQFTINVFKTCNLPERHSSENSKNKLMAFIFNSWPWNVETQWDTHICLRKLISDQYLISFITTNWSKIHARNYWIWIPFQFTGAPRKRETIPIWILQRWENSLRMEMISLKDADPEQMAEGLFQYHDNELSLIW